jgi:xanthine dehydrogenase accessory factor
VDAIGEFARLAREGEPVALVTVVGAEGSTPRGMGGCMTVRRDGSIAGTIGGGSIELMAIEQALAAIEDGRPRRFHFDFSGGPHQNLDKACTGKTDVFVQPCLPQPKLFVLGAGHIGNALARLGREAGYRVTIVDERPGYPQRSQLAEDAEPVHCDYSEAGARLPIDGNSYVVIVTHGHTEDEKALAACLHRPWKYLGLIGSRSKVARIFRNLARDDEAKSALDRVHAPIGLDLGGRSVGEIAISIVAEMQAVRHGRDEIQTLRDRMRERAPRRRSGPEAGATETPHARMR